MVSSLPGPLSQQMKKGLVFVFSHERRGEDPTILIGKSTYISGAHNTTDLFHRVQIGTQTSVHGEDLLIDDSRNGEAVEAIRESLPQLNVVPPLALIVETIDTVDGRTLVVTTENEEVLGVFDLVSQKEADGFKRLLATVNVVTEEQVVGLGREATVFEKTQKIVVLAVDITADLIKAPPGQFPRKIDAMTRSRPGQMRDGVFTLMGASNSSSMGWEMKISRALVQR